MGKWAVVIVYSDEGPTVLAPFNDANEAREFIKKHQGLLELYGTPEVGIIMSPGEWEKEEKAIGH
jgi:hypothetical protein